MVNGLKRIAWKTGLWCRLAQVVKWIFSVGNRLYYICLFSLLCFSYFVKISLKMGPAYSPREWRQLRWSLGDLGEAPIFRVVPVGWGASEDSTFETCPFLSNSHVIWVKARVCRASRGQPLPLSAHDRAAPAVLPAFRPFSGLTKCSD